MAVWKGEEVKCSCLLGSAAAAATGADAGAGAGAGAGADACQCWALTPSMLRMCITM
jgi:hypothetical protein